MKSSFAIRPVGRYFDGDWHEPSGSLASIFLFFFPVSSHSSFASCLFRILSWLLYDLINFSQSRIIMLGIVYILGHDIVSIHFYARSLANLVTPGQSWESCTTTK